MERTKNGKVSDSVRRSQALPLSWDVPVDSEINALIARLWKLTDRRRRPPLSASIEGAIMLILCMQTGEKIRDIFGAFRASSATNFAPPLLLTSVEGEYLIIMRSTTGARPIHIPQTELLTRLIAMQPALSEPHDLLFKCSLTDIKAAASELIRGGDDWRRRTPKASRSLLAHNRWLFRRMREVSKGDPALVALLQPNRVAAEQTLRAYCAVPHKTLVKYYRRAIRPLGGISPMPQLAQIEEHLVGRAKLPAHDQLRQSILGLRRILARPMIASGAVMADKLLGTLPITRDWHIAMMAYTYVLTTFGTGQRGKKAPCTEHAIDRESGFAWVTEKGNDRLGIAGERGVFHCQTVREQLARYEDYLGTLERMLKRRDKRLGSDIEKFRSDDAQLVFFDIRNNKPYRLTPYQLCEAASCIGWTFDARMGRRWLRSQLTAVIPSDALAAQFGHNLDGLDVWSKHSGLQVRDLPSILGPAIERALSSIGFEPLSARAPKRRPKANTSPDTQTLLENSRECAGQVLASLIWNGALLQRDEHESALEAMANLKPSKQTLPWILLDEDPEDTKRWLLDSSTASLMTRYQDAGRKLSPKFDEVVGAYFTCKKRCKGCQVQCKKSKVHYAAFSRAAMTRWRFKLPPILYAKAVGTLNNYDLPDHQIQLPANTPSKPRYRPDPAPSFSATALVMIAWLKDRNSREYEVERTHKRQLYDELVACLSEQRFWNEMPKLEQWLTYASVEQLVAFRGKENTAGYALSTIIKRAEQVFGYFAAKTEGKYNEIELDKWPLEEITRVMEMLPKRRVRANVGAELAALVKAYHFKDDREQVIEMLEGIPQNHRSFVITHDLYRKMITSDDCVKHRALLALCYKAGVRLGEVHTLNKDMFADHGASFTLRLDHKPSRRLKTFYSRRIIPLDVLLDDEEQKNLRKLLEITGNWLFPLRDRAEQWLKDAVRVAARPLDVSAWALRHSFATNAYAALLWPESEKPLHAALFDPALLSRRKAVRKRLCGKSSLGAIGPHALAAVMGHTSPSRTLFSYAHNLEFILAAHVASWQKKT